MTDRAKGQGVTYRHRVLVDGCCSTESSTSYAPQLNGTISSDEFRESMANINNATSGSRVPIIIAGLILLVTFIAGVALFIAGGVRAATSGSFGFHVLVGVGLGVTLFGMILFIVLFCVVQAKAAKRLQDAIAQESAKYSSRLTKPCSWRLNTTTTTSGPFDHRHTTTTQNVRHRKDSDDDALFLDCRSSSILGMLVPR